MLRFLVADVAPEHRDSLLLLVSELVTNSVRHADLEAEQLVSVRVDISEVRVRVQVLDPGEGFEIAHPVPRGEEGGWGLFLVERLAARWGHQRAPNSVVWFELEAAMEGAS